MSITSDPNDPRLTRGADLPGLRVPQNDVYLVLSDDERAQGFVRPVRRTYRHVGTPGPTYPLRDLTDEEQQRYARNDYVKYEPYPDGDSVVGRFWAQADLDHIGKGCGSETTMGQPIAETYARDPRFYGATYCCQCMQHRPVGPSGEFVWSDDGSRVGS